MTPPARAARSVARAGEAEAEAGERCGLVALTGRANVGKSTLLNSMVGLKVSIVSGRPQTTRAPVRAVLTRGAAQAVFVDTAGLHKPRTLLGQHLNRTALGAAEDADTIVAVVDARAGVGGGDRFVVERLPRLDILVVNKVDGLSHGQVLAQLEAVSGWGFEECFPVSAKTGAGVPELTQALLDRLPEGPFLYPEGALRTGTEHGTAAEHGTAGQHGAGGQLTGAGAQHTGAPAGQHGLTGAHGSWAQRDMDEREWVAELVREQLLAIAREELPYSIACQVTEWDWPFVRCEIWVERASQMGIVIGKGGSVLKRVGVAVREQLPPGAYLELSVKTEPRWQQKPDALGRLGL